MLQQVPYKSPPVKGKGPQVQGPQVRAPPGPTGPPGPTSSTSRPGTPAAENPVVMLQKVLDSLTELHRRMETIEEKLERLGENQKRQTWSEDDTWSKWR